MLRPLPTAVRLTYRAEYFVRREAELLHYSVRFVVRAHVRYVRHCLKNPQHFGIAGLVVLVLHMIQGVVERSALAELFVLAAVETLHESFTDSE